MKPFYCHTLPPSTHLLPSTQLFLASRVPCGDGVRVQLMRRAFDTAIALNAIISTHRPERMREINSRLLNGVVIAIGAATKRTSQQIVTLGHVCLQCVGR